MSGFYHPDKANVVADALSRLSMGSVAHIDDESSFVADVKAKQGLDPILVDLKEAVLKKSIEAFSQGGDGEFYWWNGMKKDIVEFVAKCPNCQQVKDEHQRLGGLSQDIGIPTWKSEKLNMDFIWVIVDRMMKSDHFIPVNVSN
ncbi:hypothetical protein MTR67_002946 [Solanum verrucosum]|uniref:Integrase zinc-binding domain-containing protein n=1 Tax=Solanum verrucosum TaxID=315347 RepID=A0AAF0T8X3_SOLVR|nr:hypothetical protein MTR67_002946 [Solanum verrucosum]